MYAIKGRASRRRRARGFTLLELMVVIILVGVISALAAPSFSQARDEAVAFDYARRYQQLLTLARSRAAGTGSAHLALLGPGSMTRGFIRVYAALDGAVPGNVAPFNPASSCKTNGQWTQAETITPPILNGNGALFIDHVDLNVQRNVQIDLRTQLVVGDGIVGSTAGSTSWLAICVTPAGATFVGSANTPDGAILNMRTSPAFTGIAEARIQRYKAGNVPVGLRRRVIVSGGGTPRLRSD